MWQKILSFFTKLFIFSQKPALVEPKHSDPTPIAQTEIVAPKPEQDPLAFWKDWCKKAIDVSQSFEGSDPWANITGNFDGAYLTCGALGFTWKYNNQPPMILKFVKQAGEKRGKELMPLFWDIYLKAAKLGENGGAGIVAAWSNGSSKVQDEVAKELRSFWKSPEMISIQIETAWQMMGIFAYKKTIEGQKFFNLKEPKFCHFVYWFDQCVLNGQGLTVPFENASSVNKATVIDWCKNAVGYSVKDLRANAELWDMKFDSLPIDQKALFLMAYQRAIKSRQQFQPVTMNRRGTLAFGQGIVNGELRKFDWKV